MEDKIFADEVPEETPSDECVCGHRRDRHVANQYVCRDCVEKECLKFQPLYDDARSE